MFEIISETTGYSGKFAAAGLCLIIAALCAIAGVIAQSAVSIVSRSFAGNIACSDIGVSCVIVSFFLLSGSLEGLLEGAVSLDLSGGDSCLRRGKKFHDLAVNRRAF